MCVMKNISTLNEKDLLSMIHKCSKYTKNGKTASYIPILQNADPSCLGICPADNFGHLIKAGDANHLFTIQSIVKILTFTCSLMDSGYQKVAKKVSVEPSNDSFNSIVTLETKNKHKPLNPMINAGSIACLTLVKGRTLLEKSNRILNFSRLLSGNPNISIDEEVYKSEKQTGSRNRALAYYMQSTNIIEQDIDIEELLDAYFRICSILVSCVDLANIALIYANNGVNNITGEKFLSKKTAKIIKATMVMCGMYEESGMVAVRIGLPAKSGVGGGILALIPEKMGIGIYGPALNTKGSSIAGIALLELLSKHLDASIF